MSCLFSSLIFAGSRHEAQAEKLYIVTPFGWSIHYGDVTEMPRR